jgi:hypothetical protein
LNHAHLISKSRRPARRVRGVTPGMYCVDVVAVACDEVAAGEVAVAVEEPLEADDPIDEVSAAIFARVRGPRKPVGGNP